jgi:hypothetical protein
LITLLGSTAFLGAGAIIFLPFYREAIRVTF